MSTKTSAATLADEVGSGTRHLALAAEARLMPRHACIVAHFLGRTTRPMPPHSPMARQPVICVQESLAAGRGALAARCTRLSGRATIACRADGSRRPHGTGETLHARVALRTLGAGCTGGTLHTLLPLIATRTARPWVSLQALGARIAGRANGATWTLLAQNTLQARHALNALIARRATVTDRTGGSRRRDLYDHFGIFGLHLALPLHKVRNLCVELLLLRAQLRVHTHEPTHHHIDCVRVQNIAFGARYSQAAWSGRCLSIT